MKIQFDLIDLDFVMDDGSPRIILGLTRTPENEAIARRLFVEGAELYPNQGT